MHVTEDLSPLRIRSRQWDYDVLFEPEIAGVVDQLDPSGALVVIDEQVAELHGEALAPLVQRAPTLRLAATEATKSLAGVGTLVDWLIANKAVRTSSIIAIGGGCIQDLVSFTAHVYYRGIDWMFLPTTVLAQADSCIGAKSGINVLPYKNLIGTLHSPRRVVITTEFTRTLPDLEIASGYGEIVKLSVTGPAHFFGRLQQALGAGGIRTPHLLELTRASLAAKQVIIEEDEYETDLRRILNYGHSFGHALEAISGHGVPHGMGVLWGIDLINWLGVRWGVTDVELAQQMSALIRTAFQDALLYRLPLEPTADALVDMVARDKKVANGRMHFALLRSEGDLYIEPRVLDDGLRAEVAEYLAGDYPFKA
jgi:3-dehydroquinate synthase